MANTEGKKIISVEIPITLYNILKEEAASESRTFSNMVRIILEQHVSKLSNNK